MATDAVNPRITVLLALEEVDAAVKTAPYPSTCWDNVGLRRAPKAPAAEEESSVKRYPRYMQ